MTTSLDPERRESRHAVRQVRSFFALLLSFSAVISVAQTSEQDYARKARESFVTVYQAERLQPDQQALAIPHIYRDVWPVLERDMLTSMIAAPSGDLDQRNQTPEELAAVYDHRGGWPLVAEAARVRCRALLASHPKEIESLVRADLASHDKKQLQRGLQAAGRFKLTALYEDVAAQLDGPEQDFAADALRELNDPQAIPLLARRGIVRHYDVIRALQRGRPADPVLLALLHDSSPDVRWRAAYALAESGDPHLTPIVGRLFRDEAAEVRVQAASIAFSLPPDAFAQLRPQLVRLLSDQTIDVRAWVTTLFADRKDTVCAKALYDLLAQEQKLQPWRQSNLVQALQNMTGSYFGFVPGTISPESARRASLDQLARWISENVHTYLIRPCCDSQASTIPAE